MSGILSSELAAVYCCIALKSAADDPCLLMPSPELDNCGLC